jgi:saccharopine dehydrogenase-like NADP-dependent oxidoreductase
MSINKEIRVLALGGCGDMGRFAVQNALDFDFVDQIVIADIDNKSAPPGKMGGITGVPLAVGLFLLASGKITRTGVFAPEAGVDPDDFLMSWHRCVSLRCLV